MINNPLLHAVGILINEQKKNPVRSDYSKNKIMRVIKQSLKFKSPSLIAIWHLLRLDTGILLQFNIPNILLTICLLQRAKRKQVLISHGNISAENKIAPYLKRRWRTSYEWKKYWSFDATRTKIILQYCQNDT